jgi:two-component system, OmpR family, sensor kinase
MSLARRLVAAFQRRPVRVRLAVVSGGLTAVILIGFALVVGRLTANRLQADFRQEIRSDASTLALNLRPQTGPDGRLEPQGVDLEEFALANHAQVRVVDAAGNPLITTDPGLDLGPPGDGTIRDGPGDLKVADSRMLGHVLTGPMFVQVARSPQQVEATIDRLWLFLAGGVLIGTMLAGFAGMMVANRAMEPIAALTRTARTIATTRDPSMRIPQPESDDEVAELARTLDQMLRELDAARAETETTIARQREFVADASHELRTPLTSILANLELLESSLKEDLRAEEDDRAAARSALRSSRRMSRLVADLLILARADAGRRGERLDCDLAEIAAEAVEEVGPVAEEHLLSFERSGPAPLRGSPDELHRMTLNLLENAIRHTPPGTRVILRIGRENGAAVLEIADDGPGLPPGKEEQLFQRFVRGSGPADRQANGEGTGLGLSIVRAVATSHGGGVSAGSAPEGGARFTVTLPLHEREPDGGRTAQPEQAPDRSGTAAGPSTPGP